MNSAQSIYEQSGVFGDKTKFDAAHDRYLAMMSVVRTLPPPARILDVGCGTGFFAAKLKTLFPKAGVRGIDISRVAIAKGRKLYPDISLEVADAERALPFPDKSFDLVVSGEHIAHLKDADTYLSELHRVLGAGGWLLITTPNAASWLNRLLFVVGKTPLFMEPSLTKSMPSVTVFGTTFPDPKLPPSGHVRLFTLPMLLFMLDRYGFRVVRKVGTSALSHRAVKAADRLFSRIPSLSSGLIVLAQTKL